MYSLGVRNYKFFSHTEEGMYPFQFELIWNGAFYECCEGAHYPLNRKEKRRMILVNSASMWGKNLTWEEAEKLACDTVIVLLKQGKIGDKKYNGNAETDE